MVEQSAIIQALHNVKDPEMERDIVALHFVSGVDLHKNKAVVHFQPETLACPLLDWFVSEIKQAVLQVKGITEVEVVLEAAADREAPDKGELSFGGIEHLNHVQKVITVMSGKGGVGKSLVAGLLAVHLKRAGYRVGILDADITGPSIPKMFFEERPEMNYTPRAILPVVSKTGIKIMSVNLLLPNEDEAVVWRGPLVGRAIKQFWTDTLWGDLDFFIVDLPPGTSDAPLTVMQSLPMSGVLLVTSPQDLAGMVVRKAANMVHQIGIPVLGLVENMSFFKAPDTGKEYEIFGPSHAEVTAKALNIPILARLPIESSIAIQCDQGKVEECQMPEFEAVAEWIETVTPECQPPKMPAQAPQTAQVQSKK
ncbi:MAG: Mrp/NBP35 family ATP-binding protein [Thermotogaceae bacterium]|nr:Mrp/NBP35 family ATP-binding protein [Thermotogaceae bacterium]